MKIRLFITVWLLVLTIGAATPLFAQDPTPTLEACPLDDGDLTIAWIPKALNNPVFELGRIGAEARAEELTAEGPCDVKLLYVAPMNTTAEDQTQLISQLVDLGTVDAIGVSCIDPDACVEPIDRAVAAGLPVMTWDSDSPDSQRFTYLGIDNYEGGQAAADLLVRTMGESGQVAVLSGVKGSANLEQRIEGFTDYLADYPDITIVTTVYSDDLAPRGAEMVEQGMSDYPDLTGWFFVGIWPVFAGRGAMPTWEAASEAGQVVTIAFDTLPVELELMQDGYLHGMVGQKYWGWGYDTVQMIYEHMLYGREFESFTNSGMDIVTPLNVDAMFHAWDTNDFTQPLPDPFEESDATH